MTDLPSSWASVRLSDLGPWIGGGTPSKANPAYWNGPIPWVSPKDMKTEVISNTIDGITEEAVECSSTKRVPPNSVLIVTRSGILAHSFPVATTRVETALNQDLKALSPPLGICPDYLAWALRACEQRILNTCRKGGTTVHSIEMPRLSAFELPIAPTNEQRRIVERIEALFDEIDKGVESLRNARRMIDHYRQSLLKSAFEGRLTADWRAENSDKLENPSDLLLRIREERKVAHQQEFDDWRKAIAKWMASSQIGKRPRKPKEPKFETTQPLLEVLRISTLPDDWGVAKVVAILDVVSGATPKGISSCKGTGVPFFKVADMNVAGNETHLVQALLNLSNEEARTLGLTVFPPGTTVFPKRGGAILTNKKRRLHQPSCFDLNIMGLVNHTTSISPEFAYFWMLGVDLSTIYDGSNVPQINNKNVEPLSFPICSPSEQAEVVRVLRSRLESVDALEVEIDATITRTHALRHSILKGAFSGQLVPQDPADEPASALLARVSAENTSVPTKGRRTRARTASV